MPGLLPALLQGRQGPSRKGTPGSLRGQRQQQGPEGLPWSHTSTVLVVLAASLGGPARPVLPCPHTIFKGGQSPWGQDKAAAVAPGKGLSARAKFC